jgi:hypothetical protein
VRGHIAESLYPFPSPCIRRDRTERCVRGRLSDAQQAMRAHLEACGFPYLCTDSVDQAIEWLKDIGILRGGFAVQ